MSTQLQISLSPDVEARLRAQATACGEELERHAERVLSGTVLAPSLDEVLASFRKEVAASGTSDDGLDSFYESLRDQVFNDRKPKTSA
ncbi:hypothetical protein [Lacipirellula parvula]|uniref:hypothetical protein n=1 Tax=Lacipirellula parvula TaxID=2650471 RepID=UPI00126071BD|nr:hypothetical protein [Lacipirellula parvula]